MKHWFLDLKTQTKLIVSFGLITILLLLMMLIVLSNLNGINNDFSLVVNLNRLEYNINVQRSELLTLMSTTDKATQEKSKKNLTSFTVINNELLSYINQKHSDEITLLNQTWHDYRETIKNEIMPMLESGNFNGAKTLLLGIQNQRYETIRMVVTNMTEEARSTTWNQIFSTAIIFTAGLFLVLICAGLTVRILTKNVSIPLLRIVDTANKISAGDLSVEAVPSQRKDEIGLLTQSFYRMTQTLNNIAKVAKRISAGDLTVEIIPQSDNDTLGITFKVMIDNLKNLTNDILNAVNVVNSATGEISTSTMQLASSASETATAVSQTTGTIEEVRQTAQQSNEKAKEVVENTQKTAEIVKIGKVATEENMIGITRIGEQMSLIAQSMQRLNEQTEMIGDILTTVDDLAQQSNLLAVNAAIEAAKAGEQGKGFSVVAQEIKTLADQSKQATNQVRGILHDVQKATGVAVMATEEGSKVVEVGQKKSDEVGDAIQSLNISIMDAAEAVKQIATVSYEQLIGVEQAATAMGNIREGSHQNVESTKQLEGAANNLKELGQKMKALVNRYKI